MVTLGACESRADQLFSESDARAGCKRLAKALDMWLASKYNQIEPFDN